MLSPKSPRNARVYPIAGDAPDSEGTFVDDVATENRNHTQQSRQPPGSSPPPSLKLRDMTVAETVGSGDCHFEIGHVETPPALERNNSTSSRRAFRTRSRSIVQTGVSRRGSVKASFMSTASSVSTNPHHSCESLINFLTTNLQEIASDREFLHRFEEMTTDALMEMHDMEFQRVLKTHGWTGSRYRHSEDKPVDCESLLQALSNYYLRSKMAHYTTHISTLFESGDEKGAEQILSFCPDLLLTCLKETGAPVTGSSDVKTYSFLGACMLADISGFSKFSGAMCLKGASGLDDLREATSGFLGHLVKTVYEFQGDG
jgi:hypothetical protein